MRTDRPEKENPVEVDLDRVSGIEGLPSKIDRYGKAKSTGLNVAEYMRATGKHQVISDRVNQCGSYLLFHHFFTVDQVRLHAAHFCKKHLLCPLCAIRRGAKALAAYLARFEVVKAQNPNLKPFLVTLTVKDGDDLAERFKHLQKSQHELWKRRSRGRGCALDGVAGAVWSYEVKRGQGSGLWHPHLHMVALAETEPDQEQLAQEWHAITGDSFIVDVRPIDQADPVSGFIEVFKYAVKFSDQGPEDTVHAWETLRGRRLLASAGLFRGVVVPEDLTDSTEDLDGLPFLALFYRFLGGAYQYVPGKGSNRAVAAKNTSKPPRPRTDDQIALYERFRRLHIEECERRGLKPDQRAFLR